jgi:aerobic-type carbon monoxide dehydrogenase small subunit (CoxS/CutS family)
MKPTLSGKACEVDAPDSTPLLQAPRDVLGLTGAKTGWGVARRGA